MSPDGGKTQKRGVAIRGNATIRAVACEAGTSKTAVSRVLNHPTTHCYSKQTEKKILDACRKLNYMPNSLARSLAKRANPAIGVIIESLGDLYLTTALERAMEMALSRGRHIVVATKPENLAWADLLNENRVGWIIAVGYYMLIRSEALCSPQLLDRIVAVGPRLSSWEPVKFHITWDEDRSGVLAVDHLARLGHEEIAILAGPHNAPSRSLARISSAYRRAQELGMIVHWVLDPDEDRYDLPPSGRRMARQILADHPNVTAIVCRWDDQALGVYYELQQAGRRVPEDMAVLGYDDLQRKHYFNPPLTSIRWPLVEAFEMAMEFVMSDDHEPASNSVDLTDRIALHERESTLGRAEYKPGAKSNDSSYKRESRNV